MKNSSKTILFFGNEKFATGIKTNLLALKAVLALGYQIPAIIVAQSEKNQNETEIIDFAHKNNIKIINYTNNQELLNKIKTYNTKTALLAAYGKIIPTSILNYFSNGIINIHPSLLPKHRGPTPIESVILNGEDKTGVSLIKLVPEMDQGPIFVQSQLDIIPSITKQDLSDQLDQLAQTMIHDHLDNILGGKIIPMKQNDQLASYDHKISKADSILDPKKPAQTLEREVRAFTKWPKSRFIFNNLEFIVTKSSVVNKNGPIGKFYCGKNQFGIYTSKGTLMVHSIIPPGKQEMDTVSFLAGYKTRLNFPQE
jgi:methionyl-tRNA formyltransferase